MGFIPEHLKKAFALVFLVVLNVIQAGYDVITSNALQTSTVHPTVFIFLRCVGATFVLWGLAYYKESRRPKEDRKLMIEIEDTGVLIAIGALALAGQLNCVAIALSVVPPSLVGMMAPLVPALALPISLFIGLEIFSRKHLSSWLKVFGAVVMLGGGATIATIAASDANSDLRKESKNLPLGIGFIFVAKTCGALYPVLQKLVLGKYRSHTVALWMYAFGSMALGFCVVPLATNPSYWVFDLKTGLALLYAIVAASAINYSLIAFCNKRLSPVILTASYPLEAVLAPLFAFLFLGQQIGVSDALGGGIIILGLFIFVYAKWRQYHDEHDEEEQGDLALTGEGGDHGVILAASDDAEGGVVMLVDDSSEGLKLELATAGNSAVGRRATAEDAEDATLQPVTEEGQLALGASSSSPMPNEKTTLLEQQPASAALYAQSLVPQSPRNIRPSGFGATPSTPKLATSSSIAIGSSSSGSASVIKRKTRAPSIFLDSALHDDDVLPTGLMVGLEHPSLPSSMKRGAASFLMRANAAVPPPPGLAPLGSRAASGSVGLANEAFLAGGATPKLTGGSGQRTSVRSNASGYSHIHHHTAGATAPRSIIPRASGVGAALAAGGDEAAMMAMITASSLPERANTIGPGAGGQHQQQQHQGGVAGGGGLRARVGSDNPSTAFLSSQHY